jgi:hypothetical protein
MQNMNFWSSPAISRLNTTLERAIVSTIAPPSCCLRRAAALIIIPAATPPLVQQMHNWQTMGAAQRANDN